MEFSNSLYNNDNDNNQFLNENNIKKNTTQMKVDNIKYVVSSSNDFIGKIVNDTKFGILWKTSLKIFHYHQQTITPRRKKRKERKLKLFFWLHRTIIIK